MYMREGGKAILSATEFHLAEPDQASISNYEWGLSEPGSAQPSYQIGGVQLIYADSDHNWYLISSESQIGHDYQVEVKVTAGGQVYSAIINIIAAKYPSSVYISYSRPSGILSDPRTSGDIIALWQNGIGSNLFMTTDDTTYTAEIKYITYTVSNGTRSITYNTRTGASWDGDRYNLDERVNVQENTQTLGLNNTPCIRVNCPDGIPSDDSVYEYTVTATIEFASNKEMTATKTILVMADSIPIVSSLQTHIYSTIANAWNTQFGTTLSEPRLYRTNLLALTGTITFDTSTENLITAGGNASLLDYLPNITGLVFDGNTTITSLHNSVQNNNHNQFVFDKMTNLRVLSIQNCTGLTEDIDLTMCPYITQVDASGTSINVLVPQNAPLTKYELGTPTEISIINPAVLTPTGVVVDSYANLDSLELLNIPNNKSFSMFDKITSTL